MITKDVVHRRCGHNGIGPLLDRHASDVDHLCRIG
jgi:hypothetical protein